MILLIAFFSLAFSELPEELKKDKKQIKKTAVVEEWRKLALNNLEMWFSNNGFGSHDPATGNNGLMFPKGSGNGVIYQDGPILSGKVGNIVRLHGTTFNTSLQAGPCEEGVDPTDPRYRIYMVRKDWETLPPTMVWQSGPGYVKDNYERDYREWPFDLGAPYVVDETGIRSPRFIGDEQAWFIMNDLSTTSGSFYGTKTVGTEWHALIWAYNMAGPLANVIFKKYTIINKGTNVIENAYLSYWSDPDLGDASDDLCGCDTNINMGFVYNGGASDGVYGSRVPAAGYTYLQGPAVRSEDPNDVAKWNFGTKQGYKNLPLTSFTFFANSNSGIGSAYYDPDFNYAGGVEFYNLIQGFRKDGSDWIDELTNTQTNFLFPGDPVTRTGWIDGGSPTGFTQRDVRFTLSSGPFSLAVGDTQELVVGIVIGRGADRLSSISIMKNNNLKVQEAYDRDFNLPSPPRQPNVTVTELPNQLVLNWDDPATIRVTESHADEDGYVFEGYRVYQLPTASSTVEDAILLATYDVVNDLTILMDVMIDPISGVELLYPQIVGTNSGLSRHYVLDRDYVRNRALVNGQSYFYAVTAYAFNRGEVDPEIVPKILENPFRTITAIPQNLKSGMTNHTIVGADIDEITKTGPGSGSLEVSVVDPTKVTGHTYEINFALDENEKLFWNVTDKVTGREVLDRWYNQDPESFDFPVVDGLFVHVNGITEFGVWPDRYVAAALSQGEDYWVENYLGWEWSPRNASPTINFFDALGYYTNLFLCPYNQWTQSLGNTPLQAMGSMQSVAGISPALNCLGWGDCWFSGTTFDGNMLPNVEIRFSSDPSKWQKGYRYMRNVGATTPAAHPSYEPFIINRGGGYPYQDFVDVPFTAWDIENNRQLSVGFLENNEYGVGEDGEPTGIGAVDGKWRATAFVTGGREFLFIFGSNYSATPESKYQVNMNSDDQTDLMYVLLPVDIVYDDWEAEWPNDPGADVTATLKIKSFHGNLPGTVYTYKAPDGPSYADSTAKANVNDITVFPNPYYGNQVFEKNKFNKFVTFSRLPRKATIKIYSLAGEFIRVIEKNDDTQFITWDLKNHNKLAVASGMYIAHIDMPELGEQKILKLAIIMENQLLDRI